MSGPSWQQGQDRRAAYKAMAEGRGIFSDSDKPTDTAGSPDCPPPPAPVASGVSDNPVAQAASDAIAGVRSITDPVQLQKLQFNQAAAIKQEADGFAGSGTSVMNAMIAANNLGARVEAAVAASKGAAAEARSSVGFGFGGGSAAADDDHDTLASEQSRDPN